MHALAVAVVTSVLLLVSPANALADRPERTFTRIHAAVQVTERQSGTPHAWLPGLKLPLGHCPPLPPQAFCTAEVARASRAAERIVRFLLG